MKLCHTIGESVELLRPGQERPVWRYVYDTAKPKPFMHPVSAPSGVCLTNFEPHDHVWHRGLWFTIKYVNEENFWEERESFGTQRTLGPPTVVHGPHGRMHLHTQLDWIRSDGKTAVIREQRVIGYVPLDQEAYAVDFATTMYARTDLLLDRTPYKKWGGYGGLIFRGSRNWEKDEILLGDGSKTGRPVGVPSPWADLSGKLDGGPNLTGGFALFDHPDNPRHPTPWYGSTGSYKFLNAAFLFHEPMKLPTGEALSLRYRVLIHDGIWDVNRLEAAYQQYVHEGAEAGPLSTRPQGE